MVCIVKLPFCTIIVYVSFYFSAILDSFTIHSNFTAGLVFYRYFIRYCNFISLENSNSIPLFC